MGDDFPIEQLPAIEKITREARQLFLMFASPAAREAGGMMGDVVGALRARTTLRVLQGAQAKLEAQKLEALSVPPYILLPLLQHASLFDDEEMIDRWAGLLASAAQSGGIHPSFPEILNQLTPDEARVLQFLSKYAWDSAKVRDVERATHLDSATLAPMKDNLSRLGLIQGAILDNWADRNAPMIRVKQRSPLLTKNRKASEAKPEPVPPIQTIHQAKAIRLTPFGAEFVTAMTGRQADGSAEDDKDA